MEKLLGLSAPRKLFDRKQLECFAISVDVNGW